MTSRWALGALLLVLAAAPAAAGSDRGTIVFSFGVKPSLVYPSYRLRFCSMDGQHTDYMTYVQPDWTALFGDHKDFNDARSNGVVKVFSLAAGNWQICGAGVVLNPMVGWSEDDALAVPFTVKPGEATYIGAYTAVAVFGRVSEGRMLNGGITILVSDESARDLALARGKDRTLGEIAVAVPDVAPLHDPHLVTQDPAAP